MSATPAESSGAQPAPLPPMPVPVRGEALLSTAEVVTYALPNASAGFAFMFINTYFLKYSTDVIGVPLVAMSWIIFAARIWDAVSDPLVGTYSDRTNTRFGRRRPWMLSSALPLGAVIVMLWSPPASLSGPALVAWTAVAFIGFYTAMTAFNIPHESLAAELTLDYRERTRVFGWRRAMFGLGSIGAMAGVFLLTTQDAGTQAGRIAARDIAFWVTLCAGAAIFALIVLCSLRIRERPEFCGRGGTSAYRSVLDVLRNPHARLLLSVFFVQQLGIVSISVMVPYYADYVIDMPEFTAPLFGLVLVAGTLSVPLWVKIAGRLDKRRSLIAGMLVISVTMLMFSFLETRNPWILGALAVFAGLAAGGLDTITPSIQADVIDVDEHRTGERKEGTYFAAWSFAQKVAAGIAGLVVLQVLGLVGYVPNAEPSEDLRFAIRMLFGGMPFVCYTLGIFVFLRFRLDARTHARIRAELDSRRSA